MDNISENKKVGYLDRWGQQRKLGFLQNIVVCGFQAFLILLFFKVCYYFYIRQFDNFKVGTLTICLALGYGLIYWFIHELAYKAYSKK